MIESLKHEHSLLVENLRRQYGEKETRMKNEY
jgi:hypothetical protein